MQRIYAYNFGATEGNLTKLY